MIARSAVAREYEALLVHFPNLTLVDASRDVARRAAQLRAHCAVRLADALQVATALLEGATAFVYAYDRSEPEKQRRVLQVSDGLARTGTGCLSAQVLSEFFVSVTRKIAVPLGVAQAIERIEHYVQLWPVLEVTAQTVLEAVRGTREYSLSFWDAQIWAAAHLNQVSLVFSEDFDPGAVVEGVRFVNPFADDFRAEEWGL